MSCTCISSQQEMGFKVTLSTCIARLVQNMINHSAGLFLMPANNIDSMLPSLLHIQLGADAV